MHLINFNNLFYFYVLNNPKLAQIQPLKPKLLYTKLLLVIEYSFGNKITDGYIL